MKVSNIEIAGEEVKPIIEGGKGVGVTNGLTAGSFAKAGAIGTVSGTNAQVINPETGEPIPGDYQYQGKTRLERHKELIKFSTDGAISQIQYANNISNGNGRIHLNSLWEAGGTKDILKSVLEATKIGKIKLDGVTAGAGMPFQIGEMVKEYGVYYYPIVSSAKAFRILYKRGKYEDSKKFLGGVVYECPWTAGGHNGITNAEKPEEPQSPYERLKALRNDMNKFKLQHVPIILAGSVWNLKDFEEYIDNPEIGKIAFQFGTRPLLTQEYLKANPQWKNKLRDIQEGEISLNKFSPTGFYSSAYKNDFLRELEQRKESEIAYKKEKEEGFDTEVKIGRRGRSIYIQKQDLEKFNSLRENGHTEALKTPCNTIISVAPQIAQEIHKNQVDCMGCLSQCRFSNWNQNPTIIEKNGVEQKTYSTHKLPDPRSYCIQKTLQEISRGGNINKNLMFSGTNGYRFATDPLYANGHEPTIQELVDTIMKGE